MDWIATKKNLTKISKFFRSKKIELNRIVQYKFILSDFEAIIKEWEIQVRFVLIRMLFWGEKYEFLFENLGEVWLGKLFIKD